MIPWNYWKIISYLKWDIVLQGEKENFKHSQDVHVLQSTDIGVYQMGNDVFEAIPLQELNKSVISIDFQSPHPNVPITLENNQSTSLLRQLKGRKPVNRSKLLSQRKRFLC